MNMYLSLLRLLCGLCFLGVSDAWSADYVWTAQFDYYVRTGASPGQACSAALSAYNADHPDSQYPLSLGRLIKSSESSFTCMWTMNGSEVTGFVANRSGDSCPTAQHNYNSETGECEPPPPPEDCLSGGPGIFSKTGNIVESDGKKIVAVQGGGTACYGQCNHTLNQFPASCYATAEGASTGFCNYIGTPDGTTCTATDAPLGSTGAPLNPPDTPDVPPSDPNDPGCPAGYGWSGTTCSKLPPPDGGDTGGGDTGGGDTGGGGGGGGGDTGGGDTGGDTGGGDTGGGDTGGGEIGDGTGGGTGSGGGTGEEGEDPVSSVGGEACTATVTCEGDAIQCAILRQQKAQKCFAEEDRDWSKAKPIIESEVAGAAYQLKDATVNVSSGFSTGTRFLPSGCPAPKSMYISTIGRTITLSWQPLCDFAGAISYIVVAMASLFFVVYVGRSFGGE